MYAALDIGGTNIRYGIFDDFNSKNIAELQKVKTTNNYSEDIKNIYHLIEASQFQNIEGIGIAIAGVLNEEKSELIKSPNLFNWENKPLLKDIAKIFKCNIKIENDALSNAFYEADIYKKDKRDFILITWGTGIGGALCRYNNEKIDVYQSEVGHQIVSPNGEQCICGQKGCLEAICGGSSSQKRLNKEVSSFSKTDWAEIIDYLSIGIINVLVINKIDLVIMSGGMVTYDVGRLIDIQKHIKNKIHIFKSPEIRLAQNVEIIGLLGARELIRRN